MKLREVYIVTGLLLDLGIVASIEYYPTVYIHLGDIGDSSTGFRGGSVSPAILGRRKTLVIIVEHGDFLVEIMAAARPLHLGRAFRVQLASISILEPALFTEQHICRRVDMERAD